MAITAAGTATATTAGMPTSLDITLPGSLQDDDYGLIWAAWIATALPTWAADDWTVLASLRAGTSTYRVGLFGKVLTAAESGDTVTMTPGLAAGSITGGATGICRVYRGVDPDNPLDVALVDANNATAATDVPAPAITTVNDDARLVTFHGQPSTANTSFTGWSTPSGLGNAVTVCSTSTGNNAASGSFDAAAGASGTYGPYTSVSPQSRVWLAATVALRPFVEPPPALAGVGGWGFIPIR